MHSNCCSEIWVQSSDSVQQPHSSDQYFRITPDLPQGWHHPGLWGSQKMNDRKKNWLISKVLWFAAVGLLIYHFCCCYFQLFIRLCEFVQIYSQFLTLKERNQTNHFNNKIKYLWLISQSKQLQSQSTTSFLTRNFLIHAFTSNSLGEWVHHVLLWMWE